MSIVNDIIDLTVGDDIEIVESPPVSRQDVIAKENPALVSNDRRAANGSSKQHAIRELVSVNGKDIDVNRGERPASIMTIPSVAYHPLKSQRQSYVIEKTACDGAKPCARCLNYGARERIYQYTGMVENFDACASGDPKYSHPDPDNAEELELLNLEREFDILEEGCAERDQDHDPPPAPPPDIEAVKVILSLHEEIMKREQAADLLVKLANLRSQLESYTGEPAARSENPFRSFLTSRSSSTNTDTRSSSKLEMDGTCIILPKYRSIGRGNRTYIARNVHTMKYIPYLDGDALADSIQEECARMTRVNIANKKSNLINQRRCAEVAGRWSCRLIHILQDVCIGIEDILEWVDNARRSKCPHCDFSAASILVTAQHVRNQVQHIKSRGWTRGTDPRKKARCSWVLQTFAELTGHSIIHVVKEYLEREPLMLDRNGSLASHEPQICALCFTFNCTVHGYTSDQFVYYRAPRKGQPLPDGTLVRPDCQAEADADDEEFNRRTRALLRVPADDHICGIFCVTNEATVDIDVVELLGFDGSRLTGRYNSARIHHQVQEVCGPRCFLRKDMRDRSVTIQTRSPPSLVKRMLRLFPRKLDLACVLAKKLQTSCLDVWYDILAVHMNPSHRFETPLEAERQTVFRLPQKFRHFDPKAMNEELPPFLPCSHPGPCGQREDGGYTCTCAELRIYCESSCSCSSRCTRRFRGCNCKTGSARTCHMNNSRCACSQAGRECDPLICRGCGSGEVLAPHNRYNLDIRTGRCSNVHLQAAIPARTYKGLSQVQGWGLYAGEDIEPYAFVGEYIGERISYPGELERRSILTAEKGLQYFFKDSKDTEIDGDRYGNKTRFINHSSLDTNKNIEAKTLYVNGENRILMHTIKKIKKGDELFYDYGYEEKDRVNFREKQQVNTDPERYSILAKSQAPRKSKRAVGRISDADETLDHHIASESGSGGRSKNTSEETGSRQGSKRQLKRKRQIISVSDDDDVGGSNTSHSHGRYERKLSRDTDIADLNSERAKSDGTSDADFEIEAEDEDADADESQETSLEGDEEEDGLSNSDSDKSIRNASRVNDRPQQPRRQAISASSDVTRTHQRSRQRQKHTVPNGNSDEEIQVGRPESRDQPAKYSGAAVTSSAAPPIMIRLINRQNQSGSNSNSGSSRKRGNPNRRAD